MKSGPGRPGLVALLLATTAHAAAPPAAVAPGGEAGHSIADRCPTFSWSTGRDVDAHEIVVYRVGAAGGNEAPALRRTIAAGVDTWTPSLEECLDSGRAYAWSVRALGPQGPSDWARPIRFEVLDPRAPEEVVVLLERLRARRITGGPAGGPEGPEGPENRAAPVESRPDAILAGSRQSRLLVVDGEVKSVDTDGAPRLWGRGRTAGVYGREAGDCSHEGVERGLSHAAVDWGSAADACPVGTWVCTSGEAETPNTDCDTSRPDSDLADGLGCDGEWLDWHAHGHVGWLAGRSSNGGPLRGRARPESGGSSNRLTCETLPVWCCWDT